MLRVVCHKAIGMSTGKFLRSTLYMLYEVVTLFGLLQRSHPSLIENLNSLTHALRKHSQPEINI